MQDDPGQQGYLQSLRLRHSPEGICWHPCVHRAWGATLSFPRTVMVSAFRAAGRSLPSGPCAGFRDSLPPHPQAIESFALMVKQTAQMLQAFGTELAETELPNDVQSTSLVLGAHTEKKAKVKVSAACGAEAQSGAI